MEGHPQLDMLTDQSPLGSAHQCDYCQSMLGTGGRLNRETQAQEIDSRGHQWFIY